MAGKKSDVFFSASAVKLAAEADLQLIKGVDVRRMRHCASFSEIEQFREGGLETFLRHGVSLFFVFCGNYSL